MSEGKCDASQSTSSVSPCPPPALLPVDILRSTHSQSYDRDDADEQMLKFPNIPVVEIKKHPFAIGRWSALHEFNKTTGLDLSWFLAVLQYSVLPAKECKGTRCVTTNCWARSDFDGCVRQKSYCSQARVVRCGLYVIDYRDGLPPLLA